MKQRVTSEYWEDCINRHHISGLDYKGLLKLLSLIPFG